ncbi:hypothetical protein F5887DRAFT_1186129 [Amanita rubescens]|nr:hypothetical protein F5887DRAFT_1186129 [Amanita rubescens]
MLTAEMDNFESLRPRVSTTKKTKIAVAPPFGGNHGDLEKVLSRHQTHSHTVITRHPPGHIIFAILPSNRHEIRTNRSDLMASEVDNSSKEETFNRKALVAEHNEEIARYETAQALASHITELPEDVLRIIFDLVCQLEPGARLTIRTHPAMILSYVCSAWRHIILEMPRVWSRYPLRIKYHTGRMLPRSRVQIDICLNLLKHRIYRLWLIRGGSIPRAELMIDHLNSNGLHSDVVQRLVAPFPFLKLRLALERSEIESLSEIPPEHLSHLQLLHIGCYNSDRYRRYYDMEFFSRVRATLQLPVRLPNLVDLTLCNCFAVNVDKLIPAVPWHNLKELRLQFGIPSMTCFDVILRQGTSLVNCALKPTSDAKLSTLPDTESPIVLPHMERLVLHCDGHIGVEMFNRLVLTPTASTRYISTHPFFGVDAYRDHYDDDDFCQSIFREQ